MPVEPVVVDGGWENANAGILGADNKAAVAVFLELARRCSVEGSPVGIELLFTVSEENALAGAKEFDTSALQSEFGYVFDHATPIGEIITASPTYFRIAADFHGRAAHAGIRPEDGRSAILAAAHAIAAMPLGRIDDQTTANVGSIQGGAGSTNIVPERCRLLAETRSVDPARVEDVVAKLVDAIHDGAAHAECDVDVTSERLFVGYRTKPGSPVVQAAEAALRACGYEPRRIVTGGGSDANALEVIWAPVREPRQRHRARPRADRAGLGRRAREHARRRLRPARRGGGGGMSSRFERLRAETKYEGKIFTVLEETFRHEDGEEATREIVRHKGAVGVVCHDGERIYLVRQPREAIGVPDLLEIPAGKLDVDGEEPLAAAKRELAEEIGKAAEDWELAAPLLHVGGLQRRGVHRVPRHRAVGRRGRDRRARAHRHRDPAARRARRADRRGARREDADRAARAAPPPLRASLH